MSASTATPTFWVEIVAKPGAALQARPVIIASAPRDGWKRSTSAMLPFSWSFHA